MVAKMSSNKVELVWEEIYTEYCYNSSVVSKVLGSVFNALCIEC